MKFTVIKSARQLSSVILGLGICAGVAWGYFQFEAAPKLATKLEGIALGESYSDVTFRIGKLERTIEASIPVIRLEMELKEDGSALKGTPQYTDLIHRLEQAQAEEAAQIARPDGEGTYIYGNSQLHFKHGKVEVIKYQCTAGEDSMAVNGIACRSTSEAVTERYSDSIRVWCEAPTTGDPERIYESVKHGVRHYLFKNRVDGFLIASPTWLDTHLDTRWRRCQ